MNHSARGDVGKMKNETQTLVWLTPKQARGIPVGTTVIVRYGNTTQTYQYEICGHFRPDWLVSGEYYKRCRGNRKFAILKNAL